MSRYIQPINGKCPCRRCQGLGPMASTRPGELASLTARIMRTILRLFGRR